MFGFHLYSILFFIAGGLILTIAGVIWSRRPAQGLVPFCLFLLAAAEWSICAGLEFGAPSITDRILIVQFQYLAVVSSGVLWLFFTLDYAGYSWWKRPRYYLPFFIIPAAILVLAFTNDFHHLIWSNVYLKYEGGIIFSVWVHGSVFLVNPIYQYILYMTGGIIFFLYGFKQPPVFRNQVFIILGATLLPFLSNIFYVSGYSLIKGMDMTPFFIFAAAAVYAVIVLHFRFLSFLPVAYQTLVQNIPDGIVILDMQNRLIELNPAAERLLPSGQPGVKSRAIQSFWPELSSRMTDLPDGKNIEIALKTQNGIREFTVNHVILKNSQANPVGKLITVRDITELKTIHKELEGEIQKRGQYTRALVHELRSPLTSIIASSDMLEDVVKQPVELSLTKNIQRAAHNLDQRVSELFELARGEVGLLKIDSETLDLCSLIEEVVAEIGPVAERKGLSLKGDYVSGLQVAGDKSRLRQVISNLLSNAIKFSEIGQIQIKLTPTEGGRKALIQVSDSGPGIPPEQMTNLFDPYRRIMPSGQNRAGLGIGLALSKIIIELHQGKIWAESPVGQGAILSFTLPLIKTKS